MMKSFLTSLALLIAIPLSLDAARVQCTLPDGMPQASLLSGGTETMLNYEKGKARADIEKLKIEYQVDAAETGSAKGNQEVARARKAYADKTDAIRRKYISLMGISLSSVRSDINPSTSALAEVVYFYTAKNSSDRIVTDVTYRPLVNGKPMSASSTFVLELIDPATMKSGLGPGESLTNQGHDPEKFQMFMGEVSPEELKSMQRDFDKKFSIEIRDMHFTDHKDYKGQFKPQTFEEAFASQLAPLRSAVQQAEAKAKAQGESDSRALKEFKDRKQAIVAREAATLSDLKKSAVRYTSAPDKKGRFVFEDVAPGTYYVYGVKPGGGAVFEKITVGDGEKVKKTLTQTKKDPFLP